MDTDTAAEAQDQEDVWQHAGGADLAVGHPDALADALALRDAAAHREKLRAIPRTWADPPPEWIATLPRGGARLSYLGHADTTLALIDVDPEWSLEFGWDSTAGPIDAFALTSPAEPLVLLARLTVLGQTRPCVGTVERWKGPDTLKELVGDAIRNGAMRFGIATGLWSRAQREGHDPDSAGGGPGAGAARSEPEPWPRKALATWMRDRVAAALGPDASDDGVAEAARRCWNVVVGAVDGDRVFSWAEVQKAQADTDAWIGLEVHGADADHPGAGHDGGTPEDGPQ